MNNMNPKIWLLITVLIILSFISPMPGYAPGMVEDEVAQEEAQEEVQNPATPQYVPGQLIVKFKKDSGEQIRHMLNSDLAIANNITSLNSVDALNRKFKVKEITPVFKKLHAKMKNTGKDAIAISKTVSAKYPTRAKRAPKDAKIPDLENIYLIKVEKGADVMQMVSEYKNDPNVKYAEPNYIVKAQMVLNDPYYSSSGSWGQTYDDLWGIKKIQCEQAWDISQGEGAVVAVIDTGIDYNHEDIAENIWINPAEIPNNGIDDDGNGFIDDVRGWDFVGQDVYNPREDNDPMDGYGHGTHCAGTIAAVGNNNIGVIGVAPKAKVMAVKGLDDLRGSGGTDCLARCIQYAADNGANVLSNSWGGYGSSQVIEDAVNYAHANGCVIVAAAGNNNMDSSYFSPANINNVITVAASDENDQKCYFSNYGRKIDVSAPGGNGINNTYNILSTMSNSSTIAIAHPFLKVADGYWRLAGTSMACPHVSGVAALILAKTPTLSPDNVRQILRRTTQPVSSDEYIGTGVVNAESALSFGPGDLFTGEVAISSPEDLSYLTGKVNIFGTAVGQSYVLQIGQGAYPTSWTEFSRGPCSGAANLGLLDTALLSEEQKYTLRLTVTDQAGITDKAMITFTPDNQWPKRTKGVIVGSMVLSDLDNDGKDEIIFTSRGDDSVHVLKDKGATFEYIKGWPIKITDGFEGWMGLEATPAVGDIDGDGEKEIVVSTNRLVQERGYLVYAWHYDGSLVNGWPTGGRFRPSSFVSVTLRNIVGDENLEILEGAFAWYGNGMLVDGWPVEKSGYNSPDNYFRYWRYWEAPPAIGDIDTDGEEEVIINGFGSDSTSFLYISTTTGQLKRLIYPSDKDEHIWGTVSIADVDRSYPGIEIAARVASVNDGELGDGKVYLWHSDGSLVNGWPKGFKRITAPITFGDIDLDGNSEIVVCATPKDWGGRGDIFVFRKDGTNLPGWPTKIHGGFSAAPVIADLDGDGDIELVAGSDNRNIYVFHHDGTIMNGWPQETQNNIRPSPAIGDTDGDGFLDVVAGSSHSVYRWHFSGAVSSRLEWPTFQHDPQHTGAYRYSGQGDAPVPPPAPLVTDEGSYTPKLDSLSASWSCVDPESGIAEYQYQIRQDSPSGTVIRSWASTGTANSVAAAGLTLTEGKTYYFEVKAKNGSGLWSAPGYSDGITVDITPPAIKPLLTAKSPLDGSFGFTAVITDSGCGVKNAFVYWRKRVGRGWSDLSKQRMILQGNSVYKATLSAEQIGDSVFKYYISAKDNAGNSQSTAMSIIRVN